uniref:Uncharacterized protein n=1 Tax=Anguilla anguilla TaxID=7936 RepID=A0A0E9TCM5_ANGAN
MNARAQAPFIHFKSVFPLNLMDTEV